MTQTLDRTAKATEGISQKLSNMGKAVAAAVAVRALGAVKDFVDDSVRAFSDLEQSIGGTEAVFGEFSKVIDEHARSAAESMGLSEAEFRTATTSIGGQLKRMTGDVQFAAEQSVELVRVAADLAATYGGTTAEAVQALGAAFRGEADPAERFNLNLKASVVNAKAVEMGLAATEREVDDNARAQAILALVTEQSADAQGQFAREADTVAGQAQITAAKMENMKAIVGETLQAYSSLGNYLQLTMGKALANLAVGIQEVTGALTKGEAAVRNFELATGQTVRSVDDLIAAGLEMRELAADNFFEDLFNDWGEAQQRVARDMPDVIRGMELTSEELIYLKDNIDKLTFAYGLNDEQAAELAETIDSELRANAEEATRAYLNQGGAANLLREDTEDLTEAIDENTEAIDENIEKLRISREEKRREVDATFNLIKAHQEAEAAQDAYNEAVKEFGPASDEAVEAGQEVWETQQALIDAALEFKQEAGPNWEAGFRQQMESAGVSADTIQRIIDKVKDLEGTIKDVNGSTINIKANVRVPKFKFEQKGDFYTPSQTGTVTLQHGGVVTGPTMGLIGEAGSDEAVIPLNRQGMEFLVKALRETITPIVGPSSGVGQPVNITVNALDPRAAARAVVEALQEYERGNGPIPIHVRSA
nr:hypothetical protein [Acidimicrobiia bacterium]